MYRRNRSRQRSATSLADIPLTPLIDTAFTLLIIFMVASPMIQNAIRVSLPKGDAKEDNNVQQELVVYIDKNGAIFFNGSEIKTTELIDLLKKKTEGIPDRTVFVKADRAVEYGNVIELVDQIKVIGGIKYVALATVHRT